MKLRLAVSGAIPGLANFTYQASVTANVYHFGPYHYGPVQAATPDQPNPVLAPTEPLRLFLGLRYELR
jgi:hypothetical protein